MPIVMFLTTSDLMRPIRIPTSAGRGAERPTMGSSIPVPNSSTLLLSFPAGTPALVTGATDGGKTEHAYSSWSKKKPAEE